MGPLPGMKGLECREVDWPAAWYPVRGRQGRGGDREGKAASPGCGPACSAATCKHLPAGLVTPPPVVRRMQIIGQPSGPLCSIESLAVPRPPDEAWWQRNSHFLYPPERGEQSKAFMEASVQWARCRLCLPACLPV